MEFTFSFNFKEEDIYNKDAMTKSYYGVCVYLIFFVVLLYSVEVVSFGISAMHSAIISLDDFYFRDGRNVAFITIPI